jgi:DNA-binding beta-propeller fold protein YncE
MKLLNNSCKFTGGAALLLASVSFMAVRIGRVMAAEERPMPPQTPAKALLVLEKDSLQLDIIDPANLKVLAKIPSGPDPHEVIASADGKTAYISNYQGQQGAHHTLTVVDLVAHKALPAVDLGALEAPHGLDFAGGKLYFTAEGSKAIGRYDPATRKIDWVMGTGQDRTHMIWVNKGLDKIVTTNVGSATVSIIEQGAPGRGNQRPWVMTVVPAGRGCEGFDVSPDGKEIWTGNAQDNTATIIDFAAKKDLQTIPVSVKGANRLKFTPDGRYVLISGLAAGPEPNLVVIEAATRKEVKQLNLGGGAAGLLMDGPRAFVAVSGGNKVDVIDLKNLSVIGEIAPLGQPDGMALAVR